MCAYRTALSIPILLVALYGCGGSPTAVTPPNPPGPAATVVIVAGDSQQALPGSALPVRPAVLVKDAAGRPVPGVIVAFAIDSGGGSLAATSATTGSDGIAVAGSWTLGSTAGMNVVRILVAGLAVVRIHAQGLLPQAATRQIFTAAAVGASGGTLQYVMAGDALNGLTVTVPAAAFPTATTWSITADSTILVPLPDGFSQVGPVLVVTDGQGYADSLITLTMPMRLAPDDAVAPFFFDLTSRTLEPIALVDRTDSSATLGTMHFSGDMLAIPGSGADFGLMRGWLMGAIRSFGTVQIVWVRTPVSRLAGTFTTTFHPGVDDWEFANLGDYISPRGDCEGMSVTAMFYHYFFRLGPAPKPGLYHQFDESLPNQWDNVQGIRFAGSVQGDVLKRITAGNFQLDRLIKQGIARGTKTQNLTTSWILLTLKLNQQPVLMGLIGPPGGHAVIAYAATSTGGHTEVSFADPNFPGQGRTMTFESGVLVPVSMRLNAHTPAENFISAYGIGVTSDVPLRQLQARWTEFSNHHAGSDRYPSRYTFATFNYDAGSWDNMGDTVYSPYGEFLPTLICPNCPSKYPDSTPDGLMFGLLYDGTGHTMLRGGDAFYLTPGTTNYVVEGVALSPYTPGEPGFVDWKPVTVTYLQGAIATEEATKALGTPTAFHFTVTPNAMPANVNYRWTFGDNTPEVTVTGGPNMQHSYTQARRYTVTARVLDAGTQQLIAIAEDTLTIAGPYWRIDTFTGDTSTPHLEYNSGDAFTMGVTTWNRAMTWIRPLLAQPNSGLISVDSAGNGTQLVLHIRPGGTYTGSPCCPPPSNGSEMVLSLGPQPAVATPFTGSFALPYPRSYWSQTTSNLRAGTMSSWAFDQCCTYLDYGGQVGPVLFWHAEFTRNGNQLSGTIAVQMPRPGFRVYTLTATRLR